MFGLAGVMGHGRCSGVVVLDSLVVVDGGLLVLCWGFVQLQAPNPPLPHPRPL